MQYSIVPVQLRQAEQQLNELAAQGWRLRTVLRDAGGDSAFVLERDAVVLADCPEEPVSVPEPAPASEPEPEPAPAPAPQKKRGRPKKGQDAY